MALGTGHFTDTDLDVFIPEVWSDKINDYFKANLVAANFFLDMSSELAGGGDVIHIPNLSAMSAATKTNGSQVTLSSPTETDIDLTVDTWEEVSFLIEDREALQVKRSYGLQERYAKNAAYEMAEQLERAIFALFSGFSQSVGASTTDLADSEIRRAIQYLDDANVPETERAFFISPAVFWGDVQNLDKFALAQNSPVNDPTSRKPKASLYGIPVYVTSLIPNVSGSSGYYNFLGHKEAIAWASANPRGASSPSSVRVQSNYIPEYLGTLVTADMLYGVVENRDNAGVRILTQV